MAGRPKGSGGRAEELTQKEIQRIDKCLTGTRHELRNRALFYFGLGSGMRISEIVALRMRDVAPHNKVLNRIVLEKNITKSKRSRTVALSKQAVQHLKAYLKSQPAKGPDAPVFPSQKFPRRPMNTTWAIQLLDKMFRDAGVANASSHSLRRTHANTLRRNGVDLMIIKEQLGHSSLATTQRYFKADPAEVQKAVDQLRF
ncbi:MAG: site-specific integrase [Proteobacteria bacterium]|nr:site-specific integrase [Pseudomonadota bacterium]